jgi:hypothetical protein
MKMNPNRYGDHLTLINYDTRTIYDLNKVTRGELGPCLLNWSLAQVGDHRILDSDDKALIDLVTWILVENRNANVKLALEDERVVIEAIDAGFKRLFLADCWRLAKAQMRDGTM